MSTADGTEAMSQAIREARNRRRLMPDPAQARRVALHDAAAALDAAKAIGDEDGAATAEAEIDRLLDEARRADEPPEPPMPNFHPGARYVEPAETAEEAFGRFMRENRYTGFG